jgi:hypothetical protein
MPIRRTVRSGLLSKKAKENIRKVRKYHVILFESAEVCKIFDCQQSLRIRAMVSLTFDIQ